MFLLKRAIREQLDTPSGRDAVADELPAIESRIDELALQAFDVYVQCREKIYQLRIDELKRQTYMRLERLNRDG